MQQRFWNKTVWCWIFFRKNVEIKKKHRGQNSFVAPHNNHTYQLDILFFVIFFKPDDIEATQQFRAGLVMIDVLSKYAVVVPIKSKTPPDIIAGTMEGLTPPAIIAGTMEGLHKMGKKCKLLYTDDERGIASADGEGIEGKRTSCLRWKIFRIFKDKPFKRVENDEKKGKQNIQWTDYILEIMLTLIKMCIVQQD